MNRTDRFGVFSEFGEPPIQGPNRPDFGPTQIRSLEELQGGMQVAFRRRVAPYRTGSRLEITLPPYQEGDRWRIRVKYIEGLETDISLADCSVVPYDDGNWNQLNWLERVEPS